MVKEITEENFLVFLKKQNLTINTINIMVKEKNTKESIYLVLESELKKLITEVFNLDENQIDFGLFSIEKVISSCREIIKNDPEAELEVKSVEQFTNDAKKLGLIK